jgi:protoporphyrinogen/coproporphyrinogen III oxidase
VSTIAVVGGGVAGLSIAHEIRQQAPDVRLIVLERADGARGNIRTERCDGYTCESGPDGFLDNAPDTLRLVAELGLSDRLLPSRDAARRRYIFRDGRLHEVPGSLTAFLKSDLLSRRGRARVFGEPFAGGPPDADESIGAFASRRIGAEAADVMIDAMVSGIYAGDARALSLRACFPKMYEMERDHGSLVRAMLAKGLTRARTRGAGVGAPAGRLTSFISGMSELTDTLAASLGSSLKTSSPVVDVWPPALGCYWLFTPEQRYMADAVVLAGPAEESAALVRHFDAELSSELAGIQSAPLAVVCLGFDARALEAQRGPLDGFGYLIPRSERLRTLGVLWESSIYANRAPEGRVLMRVMIGGAHDPEAVELPDDRLLSVVLGDLRTTMNVSVEPAFSRIVRHRRGIPQYNIGHLARLRRIDAALERHAGLLLAGNSYRGVAINACIAEARGLAARAIAAARATRKPARPAAPARRVKAFA